MNRIALVAKREFVTTVGRKGFLFGILLMPILGVVVFSAIPRIVGARSPQVVGQVTLIDATGAVRAPLAEVIAPEAIAKRRQDDARRAAARVAPGTPGASVAAAAIRGPTPPRITLVEGGGGVDSAKEWLKARDPGARHLAVIVVDPDAVSRSSGKPDFGSYQLFVSGGLEEVAENTLHEGMRLSLVRARLAAAGLDPDAVQSTMRVERPNAVIVAAEGEQRARRGFNRTLPAIMGVLLFIGLMMGGQTLMTSTIEEKSSRVVEVLLAAVSPLELMWGKLLGQLGVSLLVLAIYIGVGLFGLLQFALLGLLDPWLILWFFVFFITSFLVYAALMQAVGAAVSQIADAQSLMGPIMLLLLVPYMLSFIIGANPNSTIAVLLSFIPPLNAFIMLARMASATPPPMWQPFVTLLLSLLAAAGAVWFSAKVFRIGLLIYGKAPDFRTLVRWARMA